MSNNTFTGLIAFGIAFYVGTHIDELLNVKTVLYIIGILIVGYLVEKILNMFNK